MSVSQKSQVAQMAQCVCMCVCVSVCVSADFMWCTKLMTDVSATAMLTVTDEEASL